MGGTRAGGLKCAAKNLARNPDHYKEIGRIGGLRGKTGGFASDPGRARRAGALGGLVSRRNKDGTKLSPEQIAKIKKEYNKRVCNDETTASSRLESTTKSYLCASCRLPRKYDMLDEQGICEFCPSKQKVRRFGALEVGQ